MPRMGGYVPADHKTRHEDGGRDEISIASLSGEPATLTTHKDLATGIHGVGSGDIVGTGLTQTLTAKTLTSPTIQGTVAAGTGLTMPTFAMGGDLILGSNYMRAGTTGALPGANIYLYSGTGLFELNSTYGFKFGGAAEYVNLNLKFLRGAYLDYEAFTAADTLTTAESGKVCSNLGAGGAVLLTLPQDATVGCRFHFTVMAAQELRITPGAAGAIYINGAKQTDNKYISADDEAESVMLICDGNGDWVALFAVGTWTVQT